MKYYVIQNKITKRLVSGTDFRRYPYRQIYADNVRPPLILPTDEAFLKPIIIARGITFRRFRLVEIELEIGGHG